MPKRKHCCHIALYARQGSHSVYLATLGKWPGNKFYGVGPTPATAYKDAVIELIEDKYDHRVKHKHVASLIHASHLVPVDYTLKLLEELRS